MTREVPTSNTCTVWRAEGRWFLRESAAYYAIAKALVSKKYPRWLGDHDLDEPLVGLDCVGQTHGDRMADFEGLPNWRARRDRRHKLFVTDVPASYEEAGGEYFDPDKWQAFVRRVARFLMFVDRRRAELSR